MKVMVVGSGGREHALAWKLAQSERIETVFAVPGNPGTAVEDKVENVAIESDFESLVEFASRESIDLAVIGPEAPLVDGIRDFFDARGLRCFGPTAAAARLEGSKSFSKEFMARHGVPTAAHETFEDIEGAEAYIRANGAPIVVKADGLAAGKGVVVAQTVDEAIDVTRDMLSGNRFGDSGRRVVLEEFMAGEEATFICVCDGETVIPMATSQDHKPRDEGDRGPNTGGLGAYSPAPVVTDVVYERIMDRVIRPTLAGMVAEGCPYQGFLYAGLMIDEAGDPRVVEFNCRFGDPEAQPLLMRLETDLVDVCEAAMQGRLADLAVEWSPMAALGVVAASGGYPGDYETGHPIAGLDQEMANTKVFHAGTSVAADGSIVTNGGRVVCVVGLGEDVRAAQERAYSRVDGLSWPDMYVRRDIGYRAIARE